ncbi:MAG: hypothetical protein RLZ98_2854 [Pseudomonadota bacterium]|jgi:drug/metabolite transporter (DMT)-like permease
MLGALFALLSAAAFGLNNAYARRGMITASVLQAMIITVPIGVPLVFILALVFGQLGGLFLLPAWTIFWFALAGVVHMVWGRYCNYRATSAVGANLTGPFMQGELIVSLVLAFWILNEYLTPLRVIGIVLIFLAPMLLVENKPKPAPAQNKSAGAADATAEPAPSAPVKWQPKYTEGFLFASLAALAYGLSNVLVRLGLVSAQEAGVTNISLVGILISYAAAAVVVVALITALGQLRHAISTPPTAVNSFVFAGLLVGLSQVFRYVAFSIAPVTVVAPLLRLASLFKVLFSTLINREHEVFNGRVIMVTAISLVGALCLSISAEMVIANVPMPDWLVEIARWRWP